jgi:hypothetical protein
VQARPVLCCRVLDFAGVIQLGFCGRVAASVYMYMFESVIQSGGLEHGRNKYNRKMILVFSHVGSFRQRRLNSVSVRSVERV